MKLAQAVDYFSKVELCGWDNGRWIPGICKGAFLTYDRFISSRAFGEKKRLFMTNSDIWELDCFSTVSVPGAGIYLLSSKNVDIDDMVNIYNNIYLLTYAPYLAEILTVQTTTAASGTQSDKQMVVDSTHYCDVERISGTRGGAGVDITLSQNKITLPGDAVLTTDNEIRAGDVLYDVLEVERLMLSVIATVIKRSGGI